MVSVIEIRLARPDAARRLVVTIEFVVPATVLQIDEVARAELPEAAVPVFVNLLTGSPEERCGCGAGFGVYPVQARTDHWSARPVEGVNQPRRAVRTPGITAGTGEESAGVIQ